MKQVNDRVDNYNGHAKFLADIAVAILNGNSNVLQVSGVKEIIALYLLIPYITPDRLTTPGDGYVIPSLNGEFIDGISLKDLRDSICHSFVTIEEDSGDDSNHGKYLIFDDRLVLSRRDHDKQGIHSKAHLVHRDVVHERLAELFQQVLSL